MFYSFFFKKNFTWFHSQKIKNTNSNTNYFSDAFLEITHVNTRIDTSLRGHKVGEEERGQEGRES